MKAKKHSVIIVGGGFSGIRAAKMFARYSIFEVTLISEDTNFNYHPQLIRTKSFRNKLQLKIPLTAIFPKKAQNIDLIRDSISSIHPKKNVIKTISKSEFHYDSLVLALGKAHKTHSSFNPDVFYSAYSMKSILLLRRRLIHDFEHSKSPKQIHIVGAGATGIEFAGEVAELVEKLEKKYKSKASDNLIHLHDEHSDVLPAEDVSRGFRSVVKKRLKALDIEFHSRSKVVSEFSDGISIDATGRQVNEFFAKSSEKFTLGDDTLVRTTDLLEADGYSNVYVIGDSVSKEYGGNIATALYEADFVAHTAYCKLFSKKLDRYNPPIPMLSIPIGYNWAASESEKLVHTGKKGWYHKRWNDRKHFSKILNRRLMLKYWMSGVKTDEVE